MAKVEQDIEVEIDIPESLKFNKTIGKIKYKLHEEEVKLIIDIKKIAKKIKRLQEQLKEANKLLKYCCANYESSRFGATITEDGEILPKGPVWNYLKKWCVK